MTAQAIPAEILRLFVVPPTSGTEYDDLPPEIQKQVDEFNKLAIQGLIELGKAYRLDGGSVLSDDREQKAIAEANKALAQGLTLDHETGKWVDPQKIKQRPTVAPKIDGAAAPNLSNPSGTKEAVYTTALNPAATRSPARTRELSPSRSANPPQTKIEIPPARFAPTRIAPAPIIPASTPTSTPPGTIQPIRSSELPLGQLLQPPYTTTPYKVPVVDSKGFENDFESEQKQAFDSFKDYLTSNKPSSITDGAVVTVNPPKTGSDDRKSNTTNIYGQNGISNLTQNYADRARNAILPTIASIPVIPAIARVPSKPLVKNPPKQSLKNPSVPSQNNKNLEKLKAALDFGKIIDLLNLAMSFHNVAMLSTDVLQSMGQIIDNVLTLFGLDTSGDKSVASFVSKKFNEIVTYVLGADKVKDIKMKFAKVSAIYNSATNMLSIMQSMQSSTASILEVTGSYVGKIGNALKRVGAVQENAYGWMAEGLTARTARLQKLTGMIEGAQELTSNLEMITSDAVSIKDNIKELTEEKATFDKAVAEGKAAFIPENKAIKAEAEKGKIVD